MQRAPVPFAPFLLVLIGCAPPQPNGHSIPDGTYYAPTSLPQEFSRIEVQTDNAVTMPDGVALATDVYRAHGITGALPTILIRVPYDKSDYVSGWGGFWARRGFNAVLQDVRGRYASTLPEKAYEPFVHDVDDARVTIAWIVEQPWSNERVGVMGASYYGYTTLAAVASRHPAIKCAAPGFTSPDFFETSFRQGAMKLSTLGTFWLTMDGDPTTTQDLEQIDMLELPLVDIGVSGGLEDRLWRRLIANWDNRDAAIRGATDLTKKLLSADIPMLHTTGFYDNILGDHLRFWRKMTTEGAATDEQWLLLGPWDHEVNSTREDPAGGIPIGAEGDTTYADTIYAFFDYCLKDASNDFTDRPRVSYFTLGENVWKQTSNWPPEGVKLENRYLTGSGRLASDPPESSSSAQFVYDPADPVSISAQYDNWSVLRHLPDRGRVSERSDILVYDSPVLDRSITVAGPLSVTLYAASTAVDTDFTATLVDLHPSGYAHEVQHGIVRASYRHGTTERRLLEPGEIYEFTIDLWSTSYEFREGNRIRLEVSSSDFDRYDRNLNTGDTPGTSHRMQEATQTVYHGAEYPSRIVLPVERSVDK